MTHYGAITLSNRKIPNDPAATTTDDVMLNPSNPDDGLFYNTWNSTSTLDCETVHLVVSGKQFSIAKCALLTFPRTKLGQLASRHAEGHGKLEYVFDRNSKMVTAVLDLYRTGELHLPVNLCCMSIRRELQYWGIPDQLISECCYGRYKEAMRQMTIVDELDKVMVKSLETGGHKGNWCKELIWQTMERPGVSLASWAWIGIYMGFIALSILVVCLSTMRRYRVDRDNEDGDNDHVSILDNLLNSDLNTPLLILDTIGLVFFTVEPVARLMVTPDRKRHMKQFLTILDFVLACDHWLCFLMEQGTNLLSRHRSARLTHAVLRSLLGFRVLRIFHLARRCVKMKALLLTLRASLGEILLLFLGVSIAVIIYATSIYYVEVMEGVGNFQNIPQAIWWAIITMTTVGYGDYYPVSLPGYIVGTLCALSGLLLLSMPIAIIANNFNTYSHGLGARDQREIRLEALRECMDTSRAAEWGESLDPGQSETCWMTRSSTKINEEHVFDRDGGIDYANDGGGRSFPYFNRLRPQNYSSDPSIAGRHEERRLSEGAVGVSRRLANRESFISTQNLSSALSEKILKSIFDDYRSSRDLRSLRKENSSGRALKASPKVLSSSTRSFNDSSETLAAFADTKPKRSKPDPKPASDSDRYPESVLPELNSCLIAGLGEKSRKRKYRRRRKTWGSIPRLFPSLQRYKGMSGLRKPIFNKKLDS